MNHVHKQTDMYINTDCTVRAIHVMKTIHTVRAIHTVKAETIIKTVEAAVYETDLCALTCKISEQKSTITVSAAQQLQHHTSFNLAALTAKIDYSSFSCAAASTSYIIQFSSFSSQNSYNSSSDCKNQL